jgi:DNA replication protein DnaC
MRGNASAAARDAVLAEYVRTLKLPAVGRECPSLARQARKEGWDYEDFLKDLLEAEIRSRENRTVSRRLKEARFPAVKTLDQIDWKALGGIGKPRIMELSRCGYLEKKEDIIIAGPIGTGKTHLAVALGVEAARRRRRVLFTRAADLVRDLIEARDERLLQRLQARYRRADLLILDELGFVPFKREGGELLFNLLSDRYERRSTIVTTNLPFGEWVKVFGDEKLTTALLDRLGHHAHILTTSGASYRTQKRRTKEGE